MFHFPVADKDYIQDAGIGFADRSETHAGEDVPLHARGPMSHLFGGVHEQSYIAHAIMYAGCMGETLNTNFGNFDMEMYSMLKTDTHF